MTVLHPGSAPGPSVTLGFVDGSVVQLPSDAPYARDLADLARSLRHPVR